jgi:hypothetical protein
MKQPLLEELQILAGNRCDYCRMPAAFDPLPFQVDHIIAVQHGGQTILENLAWSCLHDNKHKGPNIAGIDPVTDDLVALSIRGASAGGGISSGTGPSLWAEPASLAQPSACWRSTIPTPWRSGRN